MHQVTEQATDTQETMTKVSMQLAQAQTARPAAELQSQAVQHKLEAAADYANADAAFACAGHSGYYATLPKLSEPFRSVSPSQGPILEGCGSDMQQGYAKQ